MEPRVIFEDKDLLVIDKPPGVVVNRAKSVKGVTVQDWVEDYLGLRKKKGGKEEGVFYKRSGVVHRLDKETSGALMIAKTPQVLTRLSQQFAGRVVDKVYLALVHHTPIPSQGAIKAPIKRSPFNRQKFGVFPGGRTAVSYYRSLKTLKSPYQERVTLVEVRPKTGRTHQIRVHLKFSGWPVVSDSLYAGRKTARKDREWCPRLFLHAYQLGFTHPRLKKKLLLKDPLPADLEQVLNRLGEKDGT
jgi:23S rRNA pseudouridine1911/1915/1917 synthase